MVARLVWDQDAAGSNPVTSTTPAVSKSRAAGFFYLPLMLYRVPILSTLPTRLSLDAIRNPNLTFILSHIRKPEKTA